MREMGQWKPPLFLKKRWGMHEDDLGEDRRLGDRGPVAPMKWEHRPGRIRTASRRTNRELLNDLKKAILLEPKTRTVEALDEVIDILDNG